MCAVQCVEMLREICRDDAAASGLCSSRTNTCADSSTRQRVRYGRLPPNRRYTVTTALSEGNNLCRTVSDI